MSDAAWHMHCQNDPQRQCADINVGQRVIAVVVMGALGAGRDALIRGRRQASVAPGQVSRSARRITVAPQFGPSGARVSVLVDFNK